MKIRQILIQLGSITIFFLILNLFYAISANKQLAHSIFHKISLGITIVSTYPLRLFLMATNIKSNAWLIELNFIVLAILLGYLYQFLIKYNKKGF
jgi:hypothetical protein